MIPFVLAIFFTLILTPVIDIQMLYFKVPRPVAILTTLVLGFLILSTFFLLVTASVNQMTANVDSYQAKFDQLINRAISFITINQFGIDIKSMIKPAMEKVSQGLGGTFVFVINSIVKILSQGILVLIFVIFLLLGKTKAKVSNSVWVESESRIKRYIVTKVVLSAITGVLVFATLSLLGIDLALVFGLFAFLLNFIPSVGSIIATLLPLPVIIFSPEITTLRASLAFLIPGAIQFAIGNVIEPKIMGDSLDLHPIVILMALIFWGMIWGIVGMLLAAPLTAIMKIIFEKIEFTRPLANLMAGRLN